MKRLSTRDKCMYWWLRFCGVASGITPFDWRAAWLRYLAEREDQ